MSIQQLAKTSLFPIVIFIGITTVTTIQSLFMNEGHFISPLDDTYIHLAVAKNFAFNHVWGITPYEFSSSSSSILWTLILSAGFLVSGLDVGDRQFEWFPILFNMIAAFGIIWFAHTILRKVNLSAKTRFFTILLLILVTPLTPLAVIGMEHLTHALATLYFIWKAYKYTLININTKWQLIELSLLASILMGLRYESVFLIGVTAFFLLLHKKWKASILFSVSGAIVPITFGIISLKQGWLIAPNSVLIKGNFPELPSITNLLEIFAFGYQIIERLVAGAFLVLPRSPGLFAIIILLGITYYYSSRKYSLLSTIVAWSIFFHSAFADVGWLNRYEGYLIPISIIVIALNYSEFKFEKLSNNAKNAIKLGPIRERHFVITFILFSLIITLIRISNIGMLATYQHQIYIQQFQMGKFVQQYYTSEDVIGLNDIGWVSYISNAQLLDIWGLGTLVTGKDWIKHEQSIEKIDNYLKEINSNKGADLIIVYDAWLSNEKVPFHPGMPTDEMNWIRVANWKVPHIFQLGDNVVSFYVFNEEDKERALNALKEFNSQLPPDVTTTWF